MNLADIQSALRDARLDGWLFYDHHHRDPLAYRILGLDESAFVTRRWYYFIPVTGEPRKLVHRIEAGKLDGLPGSRTEYSSWQEMERSLEALLHDSSKIAMQYSPRNAILYVSMVDAGTVELIRSFGQEIVSSADLVTRFEAVLSDAQIATHFVAQEKVDRVLSATWKEIAARTRDCGETDEFSLVNWMREAMKREGLWFGEGEGHGPNVSAGPNSADPHYEPEASTSRLIRSGDFILIDVWAKLAGQLDSVWYDITWTGVIGRAPTQHEQEIFALVRDARDAAIARVESAFATGEPLSGWQADQAARTVIDTAGFGNFFTHRTGHNIGVDLHGNGAHLDDLETHDVRLILPNTCFSVEPGIYLPGEFGVRSEINMIARAGSTTVTGPRQRELLSIE